MALSALTGKKPGRDVHCLLFTVKDTGPGIPPPELERLFDGFGQKIFDKGKLEGAGLGVALSHKFVQLMGGNSFR